MISFLKEFAHDAFGTASRLPPGIEIAAFAAILIGFIGVILFLVFYIFAIVGIIFFRDNDPWHFGNLQMAMLTLFRVATLEDWSDVLYTNIFGCGRYGYDDEMFGKLYFAPTFPCDTDAEISGFMAGVAVIYCYFLIIGALVLHTLLSAWSAQLWRTQQKIRTKKRE